MPEKSMKEKLAAGELMLCMNLRHARSVDIAMVAKAAKSLRPDIDLASRSVTTGAFLLRFRCLARRQWRPAVDQRGKLPRSEN
jgi:hypothetical protein